jgi:cytochrome c peroxidase
MNRTMRSAAFQVLAAAVAIGSLLGSEPPLLAPLAGRPPAPPENDVTREKVELGKELFFEGRLSSTNNRSCGTCHRPELRFTDGFSRGWGPNGELRRRVPTLFNVGWHSRLLHDGRARSLEEQAAFPLQNQDEMALDPAEAAGRIRRDPHYQKRFAEVFPGKDITWNLIAQSLAAYQRTLVSYDSDLDRYLLGDESALSDAAKRGLAFFTGEGGCINCHHGPLLSDQQLHYTGVKELLGDSPQGTPYKTPSLRDVAFRNSYFHNGEMRQLDEVIDFYEGKGRVLDLKNEAPVLKLTPPQRAGLIAFLQSLTGRVYAVDVGAAEGVVKPDSYLQNPDN